MSVEKGGPSFFVGHIEVCSDGRLAGWVWDANRPDQHETLDIIVDGNQVEEIIANQFREDLLEAGIGDGKYGFSLDLPSAGLAIINVRVQRTGVFLKISDPQYSGSEPRSTAETTRSSPTYGKEPSHNSDAEVPGNAGFPVSRDPELPASGKIANETSFATELNPTRQPNVSLQAEALDIASAVDRPFFLDAAVESDFTLVGAAYDPERGPVPQLIELVSEDQVIARTLSNKPLANRYKSLLPGCDCGFVFQLPDPPNNSLTNFVEVRCLNQHFPIEIDYRTRYTGNFERYEYANGKLRVAGWAHDRMRPYDNLKLVLLSSGNPIGEFIANKMRPDLKIAKIGMGNQSFDQIISTPLEIDVAVLEICIAGTSVRLSKRRLVEFERNASIILENKDNRETPARGNQGFDLLPAVPTRAHGHVDSANRVEVRGWAVDPDNLNLPIILDLLLDNQLVASTKTNMYRQDLADKFDSDGYHGFSFEVLPQYGTVVWRTIAVRVRGGGTLLNGEQRLRMLPDHVALGQYALVPLGNLKPKSVSLEAASNQSAIARRDVLASLIVLNLNGAKVLSEFLRSLQRWEDRSLFEVIVVDHGSTDNSKKVCESFGSLDVRLIERGRNFTFSESNNFAAKQARGKFLFFVNNDVFLCQPTLQEVCDQFNDPEIGCLGIQLVDTPSDSEELLPPIVQTIGIHFNFHLTERAIHPIETRYHGSLGPHFFSKYQVPSVTGAFLVMRAEDFRQAGGFDERYNYGYEDVDLCLKVMFGLKKRLLCCANIRAFHHRGYSRKKAGKWAGSNMLNNRAQLEENFAYLVRRAHIENVAIQPEYWLGRPLVFAFAVTEASNSTAAGDFFTAAEFGHAINRLLGWKVIFLEEKKNWYDLQGVDVLCAMRHEYDLSKTTNRKVSLITIAWARNWFQKWASSDTLSDYNLVLASGDVAVSYLSDQCRRPVYKLNIATNYDRFAADTRTQTEKWDVIFTGNFWGHSREITYFLHPDLLKCSFRIFGAGWDGVEKFAPYSDGLKAYADLPDIYRSSKIVLDDANSVTKEWGSVNSRVFDAIAAGCLVLTNGVKGAVSEFEGLVPTFSNTHELHDMIDKYLGDNELRKATARQLKDLVFNKHTYANRTDELLKSLIATAKTQRRFAIKIGAPSRHQADEWGDYHFAESLKSALISKGHVVRIDCLDTWYTAEGYGDDCVIVLRGLSIYKTRRFQCNLLWVISHPDEVSIAEYGNYDSVFTASKMHREYLKENGVQAELLLQCTDPDRFFPAEADGHFGLSPDRPLFVGNTRNVYRPAVRYAINAGVNLRVIGKGWHDFISQNFIEGELVENKRLGALYNRSEFVLNDHWDSMRAWGFISNRVFDIIACAIPCVSDRVPGLDEIAGGIVSTFSSQDDILDAVSRGRGAVKAELLKAAEAVRVEHTFVNRVGVILDRFFDWEASQRTGDSEKLKARGSRHESRPPKATTSQ